MVHSRQRCIETLGWMTRGVWCGKWRDRSGWMAHGWMEHQRVQ